MVSREGFAQQQITVARCVFQQAAWTAIVTKIGEDACVRIKSIGPVRFCAAGVEHRHFDGISFRASAHTEASLVPHRQQFAERIIRGVTRSATLVDAVNHQISAIQLIEADDLLIHAHTTQPRYRPTRTPPIRVTVTGCVWQRCQTQLLTIGVCQF